jgi:hypothetical protein
MMMMTMGAVAAALAVWGHACDGLTHGGGTWDNNAFQSYQVFVVIVLQRTSCL